MKHLQIGKKTQPFESMEIFSIMGYGCGTISAHSGLIILLQIQKKHPEEYKNFIEKVLLLSNLLLLYKKKYTIDQSPIQKSNYYITTSRLSGPKHIDVLIKAANTMKFNLKIIGVGKEAENLKKISGDTVEFMGSVKDEEFEKLYDNAKAFLFASKDDEFGIAPIEAMGRGLPVIAYASGGLKETVIEGENGYLYDRLHEDSLIQKIKQFEKLSENKILDMKNSARKEAEKYTFENFKKQLLTFIEKVKK